MKEVSELVEDILIDMPYARDSDINLFLAVCEKRRPGSTSRPLAEILLNLREYNIPTIESVGRARRKIQHDNPDLRGTEYVTNLRYENWKEVRAYALDE